MSRKEGKCAGTYLACSKHGEIPTKTVHAGVSALSTRHCSAAWAKGLAVPSHEDKVQVALTQQAHSHLPLHLLKNCELNCISFFRAFSE